MAEVPQIDGYSDIVQVARGGFGVVYRARQDRFDREVALKVLNVAELGERGQERFERECRAMGSLGWHPNVVAVFDSGITAEGQPYLVMEYLNGGSLGDRLRDGPLPWQEAVVAGVQVSGALGAAHSAGILHRDLKPENLLVGPFGETKLGDFGIAAVEGAARTTTGHAFFTVLHVAPEILEGSRPSELTDVYSLASSLHALVAGTPPFAGELGEPPATLMMRVLRGEVPSLNGAPPELADLLVLALSKDPADRPSSAAQFGRRLQQVQAEEGLVQTELRLAPRLRSEPMRTDRPDPARVQPAERRVTSDPLPTVRLAGVDVHDDDPLATLNHTILPPESSAADQPSPPAEAQSEGPPNEDRKSPRKAQRVVGAFTIITVLLGGSIAILLAGRHDQSRAVVRTGIEVTATTESTSSTTSTATTTTTIDEAALNEFLAAVDDQKNLDLYLAALAAANDSGSGASSSADNTTGSGTVAPTQPAVTQPAVTQPPATVPDSPSTTCGFLGCH